MSDSEVDHSERGFRVGKAGIDVFFTAWVKGDRWGSSALRALSALTGMGGEGGQRRGVSDDECSLRRGDECGWVQACSLGAVAMGIGVGVGGRVVVAECCESASGVQ